MVPPKTKRPIQAKSGSIISLSRKSVASLASRSSSKVVEKRHPHTRNRLRATASVADVVTLNKHKLSTETAVPLQASFGPQMINSGHSKGLFAKRNLSPQIISKVGGGSLAFKRVVRPSRGEPESKTL